MQGGVAGGAGQAAAWAARHPRAQGLGSTGPSLTVPGPGLPTLLPGASQPSASVRLSHPAGAMLSHMGLR